MNHPTLLPKLSGAALAVLGSLAFFANVAYAQASNDPNLVFDPQKTGVGGSNGGGTWDTGTTADWYNGSGDIVFPAPTAPVSGSPSGTPDTNNANANFNNVGGIVDVDGAVDPNLLYFNGTGTYTLNPDMTDGGSINFNLPASNTGYYGGGFREGVIVVNSGNVTINTAIDINADPNGNLGQTGFENSGSGIFTIANAVNFTGLPGGIALNLESYGSGSLVFTGAISATTGGVGIIGTTGNIEFGGNASGAQIDSSSGTTLLDAGATNYTGLQGQGGAILTNGGFTVGLGLNQFTRGGSFGGATADDSTFLSSIQNYVGTQSLVAAAGGKVNFDAEVNQFGGAGTGSDLLINETSAGVISTGVVSLNNATGQTFGQRTSGSNSDVGTEIVAGTLLIMNTSGSATGNGALGTVNNTVQLDTGAALGGTGYTQQNVVAVGSTSVITPGDMTKGGVSSIGTLHLDNGLAALNGLTANFQLAGPTSTPYDQVEVSTQAVGTPVFALDLAGPVTINLSGTIDTADTYTLFYSTAGTPWEVATGVYTFNGVPAGYTAVETYVPDNLSNGEEELNVSFLEVPEPSTWVLIGLGALVLIGTGKFRRLEA